MTIVKWLQISATSYNQNETESVMLYKCTSIIISFDGSNNRRILLAQRCTRSAQRRSRRQCNRSLDQLSPQSGTVLSQRGSGICLTFTKATQTYITMYIEKLDDSGKTQFNLIRCTFDLIRFTGALSICYVAHKPLT